MATKPKSSPFRYRSSVTGRFVSPQVAKRRPRTTQGEMRNSPAHSARVMTPVGMVKVSGTKAAVENHIAFVKRNRGR